MKSDSQDWKYHKTFVLQMLQNNIMFQMNAFLIIFVLLCHQMNLNKKWIMVSTKKIFCSRIDVNIVLIITNNKTFIIIILSIKSAY